MYSQGSPVHFTTHWPHQGSKMLQAAGIPTLRPKHMAQQDLQHGILQVPAPQDLLCSNLLVVCMSLLNKAHEGLHRINVKSRRGTNYGDGPPHVSRLKFKSSPAHRHIPLQPSLFKKTFVLEEEGTAATRRASLLVVTTLDKPQFSLPAHVWEAVMSTNCFKPTRLMSGRAQGPTCFFHLSQGRRW